MKATLPGRGDRHPGPTGPARTVTLRTAIPLMPAVGLTATSLCGIIGKVDLQTFRAFRVGTHSTWDIDMSEAGDKRREDIVHDEHGHIHERKSYLGKVLDGEYTSYFANGQIMANLHFTNGQKDGEATSYYRDGQVREKGSFKNDRLDGEYSNYYENGQVREIEHYQDGKLQGTYRMYFKNGQLKEEETFTDGKFNGPYVSYYKSGELKEKGAFVNDKRDGEYVAYYRSGRVKEKALYRNGKLEGPFQTFDEQGVAIRTPAWDNDAEPYESGEDLEEKEKRAENLLRSLSDFEKHREDKEPT